MFYCKKTMSRVLKCMRLSHQQRKRWHTKDWNKLTKHEGTVDSCNIIKNWYQYLWLRPCNIWYHIGFKFHPTYFWHNITKGSSGTEKHSTVEKNDKCFSTLYDSIIYRFLKIYLQCNIHGSFWFRDPGLHSCSK